MDLSEYPCDFARPCLTCSQGNGGLRAPKPLHRLHYVIGTAEQRAMFARYPPFLPTDPRTNYTVRAPSSARRFWYPMRVVTPPFKNRLKIDLYSVVYSAYHSKSLRSGWNFARVFYIRITYKLCTIHTPSAAPAILPADPAPPSTKNPLAPLSQPFEPRACFYMFVWSLEVSQDPKEYRKSDMFRVLCKRNRQGERQRVDGARDGRLAVG